MKKSMLAACVAIVFVSLMACGGTPPPAVQAEAPAATATAGNPSAGEARRIGVLLPSASGLAEGSYLPALVQGELWENFHRFSGMFVLDRLNLERTLLEIEMGLRPEEYLGRLGEIEHLDYILTGSIIRTGESYALNFVVSETGRGGRGGVGISAASFFETITEADMRNFSGKRRASLQLLDGMGVELTAATRQELSNARSRQAIDARLALARGVTAQSGGSMANALFYYSQAAVLDPTLEEASGRSMSVVSSSVATPHMSSSILRTIQAHDERMREQSEWRSVVNRARAFYAQNLPYEFAFSSRFREGPINFQRHTVDLIIDASLNPTPAWNTIHNLQRGLATARQGDRSWNFNLNDMLPRNLDVVMAVSNDRDIVLAQARHRFTNINDGRALTATITFQNVRIHDATGSLNFQVISINGIPAQTAVETGFIQISHR
ncbi:MAG: hypothetical protein FWB99_03615 [Treponema sp.]|nr:hypothetical protein [Treponema sp.]